MSNLTILIVEDNSLVAEALSCSLEDRDYKVVGKAKSGKEAIEKAADLDPDLIIMDINLKGDMDGIEAAKVIKGRKEIPLIFLTAHSDNSTFEKAKSVLPDAFITKPYQEDDLSRAIDLAIHNFSGKGEPNGSSELKSQYVVDDAIFIKVDKKYVKIRTDEINYIEADGSYCRVNTTRKEYLLTMNLRNFETRIQHPHLMRISRSFVINVKKVDSFEKDSLTIDNRSISVSRQYLEDFRKRFMIA